MTMPPPDDYTRVLASLYDVWKASETYDLWADWVLEPITKWGNGGDRLLDVGCGTGNSSIVFASRGFQVTGCDISVPMLDIARNKLDAAAVTFHEADIRALPAGLTGFDVVLWMDDVANHFTAVDDLNAALHCSSVALAPGGLLIFDANSVSIFQTMFTSNHVVERPDTVFTWIGGSSNVEPNAAAKARITAFHRHGEYWIRTDSSVHERHYSRDTISRGIEAAELDLLAVYGLTSNGFVEPADEMSQKKITYIARKPA